MPLYNYICNDCLDARADFVDSTIDDLSDEDRVLAIFETRHCFHPDVDELLRTTKCPFCESQNTEKTMLGVPPPYVRVRGHNWYEFRRDNKAALSRDMALHQLTAKDEKGKTEDPYAQYRAPGEADDLAERIKKGRQAPDKSKHYDMSPKSP